MKLNASDKFLSSYLEKAVQSENSINEQIIPCRI